MPFVNPTLSQLHIDRDLTNYSEKIVPDMSQYVVGRAFPSVPVMKQSDKFHIYDRAEYNRNTAEEVAPGAPPPYTGQKWSNSTYFAKKYGQGTVVTEEQVVNEDEAIELRENATMFVTDKVLKQKEVFVLGEVFKANVWGRNPSAPSATWNADTNQGDPIADVLDEKVALKAETGLEPNSILMTEQVFNALLTNERIIDRIAGMGSTSNPAIVNKMNIAAVFGVSRIEVAGAIQNTAGEGLTASHSYIASGGNMILYHAPLGMTTGRMTATAASFFNWTGLIGTNNMGVRVRRYWDEETMCEKVIAETAYDFQLRGAELGSYMTGLTS